MKSRKNRGFTVIEMVVVVAVVMTLSGTFAPKILKIVKNSQIAADQSNLSTLNESTTLYSFDKSITNNDIFDGIELDEERMQELVDKDYLSKTAEPKQKDASFNWEIGDQEWVYNSEGTSESASEGTTYLFGKLGVSNFKATSNWSEDEDGLSWLGGNSEGLFFIDNQNSEYTVTTTATLGEGSSGGYGILFETSLAKDKDNNIDVNNDTGYALQFDRGYGDGAIIIRDRNGGKEDWKPLLVVKSSDSSIIPNKNSSDSSWWTDEHEVKLEVSNNESGEYNKELNVYIDGEQVISSFAFSSDVKAENNVTGFRSWSSGTSAPTYESLTIK